MRDGVIKGLSSTCAVAAVETWIKFAKLAHGPLFRPDTGQGEAVGPERSNEKEVARLVKRAAMAVGVRNELVRQPTAVPYSNTTR
jgi:hypothetical protein